MPGKISTNGLINNKEEIDRTVQIGTVNIDDNTYKIELNINIRKFNVKKLTVDLTEVDGVLELGISGSIYKTNTDFYSAGQINETLENMLYDIDYKVPQGFVYLSALLMVWKRWHLNTMRAGTKTQQYILDMHNVKNYNECVELLKQYNLYEDKGYKYGYMWLVEPLPEKVVKFIHQFVKVYQGA